MSNRISRRTFLKCTGASAAAVGAASLLGGCRVQFGDAVEVQVGDKINNWNNLAVQLSGVYVLANTPDVEGYQYVVALVSAGNRSTDKTFTIGAQNITELDAAYPMTDEATTAANFPAYFHAMAEATTDFSATCDDAAVETGVCVSLYDSTTETFTDSPNMPPQSVGYIELVCLVPTDWQTLTVTYTPTFVEEKSLVFTMSADDLS